VLAQALPGFLFDLEPVPFRDALLDPADQDAAGVHAFQVDRLVGGQQRNPGIVQLAFQLERVECVPPGAFDVLADHGGEPGVRPGGFGEQVRDPAVTRDAHVEPFVRAAVAALLQVHAARFDVPEPGGDKRPGRGLLLRRAGLPPHRRHRVLDHSGAGAAEERQR
jgi:hypothetical protein